MKAKRKCHRTILRVEALEDRCVASAGALDPTFGSGGTVTTSFGNTYSNAHARALAIQPNGQIVAGGDSTNGSFMQGYFDLARYNANGSLDSTFGSKGLVQTKFASPVVAHALALQSDGKILLAGAYNGTFEIVRYNSNGSLDTMFGNRGKVSTPFPQGASAVRSLALETLNGVTYIVAVGDVDVGSGFAFGLARYNLNGSLDTSFGSGGEVVTSISTEAGEAEEQLGSVAQGDGKIVVVGGALPAGASSREFALARYSTDGSLDSTFGSGGIVFTAIGAGPAGAVGHAVALQPNGELVVGGEAAVTSYDNFAVARYNADGSLDTSFGSGGIVTTAIGSYNSSINGLAIQPADGKIIAVGVGPSSNNQSSALARYNPDGSLDTTFGSGGIVSPTFGTGDTAVALQSDGKIVVSTLNSGNFGVARYLPSEPQIGSFTASPNPVTAGSGLTLTASNVTDGNANSTITQVAFYVQNNGSNTLLGYGTQTSTGVWALASTNTSGLSAGTYTLFAQAEDSYGVFGDPVLLALTVQ